VLKFLLLNILIKKSYLLLWARLNSTIALVMMWKSCNEPKLSSRSSWP